jgi:hypothetical protein
MQRWGLNQGLLAKKHNHLDCTKVVLYTSEQFYLFISNSKIYMVTARRQDLWRQA